MGRMTRTSVQLDGVHIYLVESVMKQRKMTRSQAIRFILDRYREITTDLQRRGVTVREYPSKIELEFPR